MDEEEEIQSDPSRATPSLTPSPPRATVNGRMAVNETCSSTPPSSQPPPPSNLSLALHNQRMQQRPASGGTLGGRDDCWSEGATAVLIDAWGERYLELSRGNLKQKHWSEVAEVVTGREGYSKAPKTDVQCKNRIDTVKKKYKIEKAKMAAGGGSSNWLFFEKLDRLIGQTSKYANSKSPVAMLAGSPNPNPNPKVTISSGSKLQNPDVKGSKSRLGKRSSMDSGSEPDDLYSHSNDVDDDDDSIDLPPRTSGRKKAKVYKEVKNLGRKMGVSSASGSSLGNSIRELTRAILKFGEVYENTENAKLQQIVEIEKQRMQFAKDMELQRTQFFMKTQLENSRLKRRDKGGGGSRSHPADNGENNDSGSSD